MSKSEKQLQRLLTIPKNFSWDELVAVMEHFNFEMRKTSGSGRKFVHKTKGTNFAIHAPHPSNIMKAYALRGAINALKQAGEIE